MADVALPRRRAAALGGQRVQVLEWVLANWEVVAVAAVVVIAAVLRFWDLGSRALHHDESLHATFSWYLYDGRGFKHDPLMHGPFQFQIDALAFFLLGATDYTARVPHALFGTTLVAMPLLLRRQIGMRAVLIASVLLAFSPTLLYFSRFDREDILTAVWTFATVICLWRYLDEQKTPWLCGMAASLALAFATKETTFITIAIILIFLDLMLAVELGKRAPEEAVDSTTVGLRTAALVPIAWIVAAFWPLLGRKPLGRDRLPAAGDALVVLGTLALPQFSAAVQVLPFVGNKGYNVPQEESLRVTTVVVLLVVSAYFGLMWKPREWAIIAAFFWVPFVVLFTTFFTNTPAPWEGAFWNGHGGFFSGTWGSLDYWLDQHHVKRGNQPVYYYTLVTPLYEFLPLLLAVGGAVMLSLKSSALRLWLFFWFAAMFVGLSVAGEKMPWLEVHLVLPLAIAAAVSLAAALEGLRFAGRWALALVLASLTVIATLLLVEVGSTAARYAGFALLGGLAGWTLISGAVRGWREMGRAALTIAVTAMFVLTVRASYVASFQHGDIPVEMLVYTQTSPQIPGVRDRIDAVAKRSGLGHNLPIVVDGTDAFAWPWAWYLRDYHEVSFIPAPAPGYRPPPNAVALIARVNRFNVDATGYTEVPYKHRWWFPETYRDLTVSKVLKILRTPKKLESLGHFFLYRRAAPTDSSVDAVALFPDSFVAFDRRPAPAPVLLADGRTVIGRPGGGPAEFQQPADVFVDAAGNIWVADALNGRVQEFDAQGNALAIVGRFGSAQGQFKEPWSVAVDQDGNVYVADTWNHRIQKFSPSLDFVAAWGQPAVQPTPGPFDLFGPRDIAIAPNGTLWVTDTGNKRLLNYSTDGQYLGQYGAGGSGPGQFQEDVGLTFDASGNLYVADAWNARIQKFAPGFASQSEFPAPWTSREVLHKPYLAVLTDGRVVASDPARGALLLYDRAGAPLGQWRPDSGAVPLGVAATADGGFVFSDANAGQVQVVPAAAISRLFK